MFAVEPKFVPDTYLVGGDDVPREVVADNGNIFGTDPELTNGLKPGLAVFVEVNVGKDNLFEIRPEAVRVDFKVGPIPASVGNQTGADTSTSESFQEREGAGIKRWGKTINL